MSNLLYYLNRMHKELDVDILVDEFINKFGVVVKVEKKDDYVLCLFKYHMLEAKWSFPLVHECRGIIVKWENKAWKIVARPFDKFFNVGESFCPLSDKQEFAARASSLSFVEKADGTCIVLWNDRSDKNWEDVGQWRVSTLGMINSGQCSVNSPYTFEQLFFRTLGISKESFVKNLFVSKTYIFELATKENAIVTQYNEDMVYLLGIRDNENGFYEDSYEIDNLVEEFWQETNGKIHLTLPFRRIFKLADVSCYEDAVEWVEGEGYDILSGRGILNPEGYVIYSGQYPLAKMKNSQYLTLHAQFSGGEGHVLNNLVDNIFNGTIDDVYPSLTDRNKVFVDNVRQKLESIREDIFQFVGELKGRNFPTRKEFALYVQENGRKEFSNFFFQWYTERDNIRSITDFFWSWMQKNYSKYENIWRG